MSIFLSILFILKLVYTSDIVLQNQWLFGNCEGPPTNMILFKLLDPYAIDASENNETWPEMFTYFALDDSIGSCGMIYDQVNAIECCRSSLNLTQTVYQSVTSSYINSSLEDAMLTVSNGGVYCQLNATSSNSLFGYDGMFILLKTCSNGIQCFPNEIKIYDSNNCSGVVLESFEVTDETRAIESQTIGIVNINSYTIIAATGKTLWMNYFPQALLIPKLDEVTGIIHLSLLICSLIGLGSTVAWYSLQCFKKGTRREAFNLLPYLFILAYAVNYTIYVFTVFDEYDMEVQDQYEATFMMLEAIGTFLLSVNTTNLILTVYPIGKFQRIMAYMLITTIHIILRGSAYFEYWYPSKSNPIITASFLKFMKMYWRPLRHIWIGFILVFNFLPMLILLHSKLKTKTGSILTRFFRLLENDHTFSILLQIYLVNIMIFSISKILMNSYRIILRNDRIVYIFLSTEMLIVTIHSIIYCLFLKHLKTILENRQLFLTIQEDPYIGTTIEQNQAIDNQSRLAVEEVSGKEFNNAIPKPFSILTINDSPANSVKHS
ncbi:hypothetical protein BC833DRAFT_569145 [Globomyces pollinis-pini]|nr:hypothetical protein BC833DRAFT_569145 [Globomyces pollinis-pini]